MVGVLVLVDHHVAEPPLPVPADVRERLQQADRLHDHVVEVHGVGGLQPALVVVVDLGHGLLEEAADRLRVQLRRQQPVLGAGDRRVDRARREPLGILALLLEDVAHQPHLVGLVVDREARAVADQLRVAAQHPAARRVERHHPHAGRDVAAHQLLDALLHLGRRPVGERDGEDLVRLGPALGDQVGDAVRQHPRLAGARAGDHQQRPLRVEHGLPLLRIQCVEAERGGHGADSTWPSSSPIQAAAASSALGSADLSTMSTRRTPPSNWG